MENINIKLITCMLAMLCEARADFLLVSICMSVSLSACLSVKKTETADQNLM